MFVEKTASRIPVITPEAQAAQQDALLNKILNDPKLPSAPFVALKIVEQASKPDCEVEEIVKLLSADPAICAQLLKILNSCIYSLSYTVTSVQRAVTILGLHPLRSIVLGLALPALQNKMKKDDGLRRYWKVSVAGAIIARELALLQNDPLHEEAFICGLLCDLGRVILQQTIPKSYEPVWAGQLRAEGEALCAWEQRNIGLDHPTVSAGLLKRWRLPNELVAPVLHHHSVYDTEEMPPHIQKRTALLDFSQQIACMDELKQNDVLKRLIDEANENFRMDKAQFNRFLMNVRPKIEAFANLLNVDIGQCPNYTEVLSQGSIELHRLSLDGQYKSFSHFSTEIIHPDKLPPQRGEP